MQAASDDNASSSASENCDADSDKKIEDSDDDGSQQPSPNLFRQEQADENADPSEDDDSEDNQSDDGSIPELCYSEDEDDYQPSESTPAAPYAAAVSQESLLEKFSELTRQFATLVEQNRKRDLMSRKSASKSLNFDSPKRRRIAPYTPKHRAPEIIPATQEEDDYEIERDSVRSSSTRSTRIRLQDKNRVIDEKPADYFTSTSHKDWIKKHASQIMAQSGNPDDIEPDSEYVASRKFRFAFILFHLAWLATKFSLNVTELSVHVGKVQGFQKRAVPLSISIHVRLLRRIISEIFSGPGRFDASRRT
jgi:hypothetical protein